MKHCRIGLGSTDASLRTLRAGAVCLRCCRDTLGAYVHCKRLERCEGLLRKPGMAWKKPASAAIRNNKKGTMIVPFFGICDCELSEVTQARSHLGAAQYWSLPRPRGDSS